MSLAQLVTVVPPPGQPLNVGSLESWSAAQQELGIELPLNYLEYALRYGSGDFADPLWLTVWNPLNPEFVSWVRAILKALGNYNKILADGEVPPRKLGGMDGIPLHLHPNRPGFLPIGGSLIGDTLGFWTEGEVDQWPVVFVPRNPYEDYGRVFRESLTEFLAKLHSEPRRTELGPFWDPAEEPRPERPEFQPSPYTC